MKQFFIFSRSHFGQVEIVNVPLNQTVDFDLTRHLPSTETVARVDWSCLIHFGTSVALSINVGKCFELVRVGQGQAYG